MVTWETKHWNNFEIISGFYFTCNHGISAQQVKQQTVQYCLSHPHSEISSPLLTQWSYVVKSQSQQPSHNQYNHKVSKQIYIAQLSLKTCNALKKNSVAWLKGLPESLAHLLQLPAVETKLRASSCLRFMLNAWLCARYKFSYYYYYYYYYKTMH